MSGWLGAGRLIAPVSALVLASCASGPEPVAPPERPSTSPAPTRAPHPRPPPTPTELPLEQREVLVLRIWAELSFPEIAEILDVGVDTAASRHRYALAALRKLIPVNPLQ